GLSACDTAAGYAVFGVYPELIEQPDGVPEVDYSTFTPKENYGDGTVAPYAAGSTIMFDPGPALRALRYYRGLATAQGAPLVWRAPARPDGMGFKDSFNLGTGWVAPDYVAIDQGPLLLAIENARTGFVWDQFHKHEIVRVGLERLKLSRWRFAPATNS